MPSLELYRSLVCTANIPTHMPELMEAVGEFLDVAFKANLYNLRLLEKELKRSKWATAVFIFPI